MKPLSFICIALVFSTIYLLINCSVYGESCRTYSLLSFRFFLQPFVRFWKKNKNVIYQPRSVKSEGNISSIELAPSLNGSQWPEFLCSKIQPIKLLPTSTFIRKVNDKICPNSTANININTPNTLDPTIEVTQHQHKASGSTTKQVQQFGYERLEMAEGSRDLYFHPDSSSRHI